LLEPVNLALKVRGI